MNQLRRYASPDLSSCLTYSLIGVFFQPTGGVLLLLDRTPDQPVQQLELKVRKVPATSGHGQSVGGLSANQDNTGGAAAAVNILNAEDDEGDDDAPVPEGFEYHTDSDES